MRLEEEEEAEGGGALLLCVAVPLMLLVLLLRVVTIVRVACVLCGEGKGREGCVSLLLWLRFDLI